MIKIYNVTSSLIIFSYLLILLKIKYSFSKHIHNRIYCEFSTSPYTRLQPGERGSGAARHTDVGTGTKDAEEPPAGARRPAPSVTSEAAAGASASGVMIEELSTSNTFK